MNEHPITEADLHAYVDEALDAHRRREVQDHLDRHPAEARRVAAFAEQRRALRAALAPIAEEPVPPELGLKRLIAARRAPHHSRWRSAAAAILLLGLGGAGGWLVHGPGEPAGGIAALAQEAAASYEVYAPDHIRPVELKAAERGELMRWVAQRLHRPVAAPDLAKSGYRFMGGRLVATAHGPAALFLYDDDHGTRLAMLARPMPAERHVPMSQHADGSVVGFAWADRGIGYSLVADVSPETLHPLANEARRQIDQMPAAPVPRSAPALRKPAPVATPANPAAWHRPSGAPPRAASRFADRRHDPPPLWGCRCRSSGNDRAECGAGQSPGAPGSRDVSSTHRDRLVEDWHGARGRLFAERRARCA